MTLGMFPLNYRRQMEYEVADQRNLHLQQCELLPYSCVLRSIDKKYIVEQEHASFIS
jgi:hypothetical protein